MTSDQINFGPRPELIGQSALKVHQVQGEPANDTAKLSGRHPISGFVNIGCDLADDLLSLLRRYGISDCVDQDGRCPPKFLDIQCRGPNVFVFHDGEPFAVAMGRRLWRCCEGSVS